MNHLPDQLSLNIQLDDSISLDKFILCESNEDSLNFIRASLKQDSVSNLFYLWGSEGVGKSYLMKAINKEYVSLGKKVFHLSLDDPRVTSHEILQNLDSMDIVLIERIDCLAKEEVWETQMFSLVNSALKGETKVYFSSCIVAKDLKIELRDLMSRLSYFTAIEIPEITQEEKEQAISQSSLRRGISLDKQTVLYILNHSSRSLSDLLRLLEDLDNYSLKRKRKITKSLISEMLKEQSGNLRK